MGKKRFNLNAFVSKDRSGGCSMRRFRGPEVQVLNLESELSEFQTLTIDPIAITTEFETNQKDFEKFEMNFDSSIGN